MVWRFRHKDIRCIALRDCHYAGLLQGILGELLIHHLAVEMRILLSGDKAFVSQNFPDHYDIGDLLQIVSSRSVMQVVEGSAMYASLLHGFPEYRPRTYMDNGGIAHVSSATMPSIYARAASSTVII